MPEPTPPTPADLDALPRLAAAVPLPVRAEESGKGETVVTDAAGLEVAQFWGVDTERRAAYIVAAANAAPALCEEVARLRAELAAATERAAEAALADPNPCLYCNAAGAVPDARGRGIAGRIRGAGRG